MSLFYQFHVTLTINSHFPHMNRKGLSWVRSMKVETKYTEREKCQHFFLLAYEMLFLHDPVQCCAEISNLYPSRVAQALTAAIAPTLFRVSLGISAQWCMMMCGYTLDLLSDPFENYLTKLLNKYTSGTKTWRKFLNYQEFGREINTS